MKTDKNECIDFWSMAKERIVLFEELDDAEVVFGARTRGNGHRYKVLPLVTDKEMLEFEKKNGFELSLEYRTFLQTFGAGGAGPYYGIYDFRKNVLANLYTKPFPYTSTFEFSDEVEDDDPIWDYDGLAFICEAGCGTDYFIELNGSNPGQMWCSWTDECSIEGSFLDFYKAWFEKVDIGLHRYQLLKELSSKRSWFGKPKKFELSDVVSHMQCEYEERAFDGKNFVPEGQIWVQFDKTPGRVILNEKREILRIDIHDRCAIC
ncbi:SMI1/KNR4 family protein [Microbulbifer variabilis]|uniref:SMI1/KNR4 family protein n=1 Tax=Microbulbifer variabilis TaxID=266805 RepID=UPI0003606363|nr:SMI1/KNR4 family protein [Microbulbifer variabilis]